MSLRSKPLSEYSVPFVSCALPQRPRRVNRARPHLRNLACRFAPNRFQSIPFLLYLVPCRSDLAALIGLGLIFAILHVASLQTAFRVFRSFCILFPAAATSPR